MNTDRWSGMSLLRDGVSRSVSPENPTGDKGGGGAATEGTGAAAARDLGPGWKCSEPVAVNPHGGLNCYWQMPFRRRARMELENLGSCPAVVYFQIDYDPLRAGHQGHDPGTWLACGRQVPPAERRHRLDRVVVRR